MHSMSRTFDASNPALTGPQGEGSGGLYVPVWLESGSQSALQHAKPQLCQDAH